MEVRKYQHHLIIRRKCESIFQSSVSSASLIVNLRYHLEMV